MSDTAAGLSRCLRTLLIAGVALIAAVAGARPGLADVRADCERLASPLLEFVLLGPGEDNRPVADGAAEACAAALGQSPSDPRLNLLYGLILIEHDEIEAGFVLVERAADAGDSSAEFFVGALHRTDTMPWSTRELAREWFERAAHKGHSDAQLLLGEMHHRGIGGETHHARAAFWIAQAADQGHPSAIFLLGTLHAIGEGVAQDDERSQALLHQAAAMGYHQAQYLLGYFYLAGIHGEPDAELGLALIEASADQGNSLAMIELGKIYLDGDFVVPDRAKALAWFCRAGATGAAIYADHTGGTLTCE